MGTTDHPAQTRPRDHGRTRDRTRTHDRSRTRRLTAAAAAAAAVTALGTASAVGAPSAGDGAAGSGETPRKRIATSVLGQDYKITLTALRSPETPPGEPPTASVRMRALTYENGAWRESDRVTVGEADGWFWHPLTGRHAVCEFSTASTEPAPVEVGLLITPSTGCSPTESFRLVDGRFQRG